MDKHRPLHLVDRGQAKHLGTFIPTDSFKGYSCCQALAQAKMGVLVVGNKAGGNQATPQKGEE